jgi:hypothetical protein
MNNSPFFLQFTVRRRATPDQDNQAHKALATVIVFAANDVTARSRAGRLIGANLLEIESFDRIQRIHESRVPALDKVLRDLFSKAEFFGGALHLDFYPARPLDQR